ncbi:MAG: beta-galactosidase [Alistipes sp.]|nr:beta-galactosidase [Alistipes sp.]
MKRYLLLLFALGYGVAAAGREVIPFNEGWRFYFQSEKSSDNARSVTLPHSWNTDPTAGQLFIETTGCYLNTLHVPASWAGQRLFVKFYGAQSVADLFVNGKLVGSHCGGATAFVFEITDRVRFGAENDLLVTVNNSTRNDVLPTSTDINRYGGLYRPAELILTSPTAVSPLYLGTDGVLVHPQTVSSEKVAGEIEIHLTSRTEENCQLTLDIIGANGRRVFSQRQRVRADGNPVVVPFTVEQPRLWSPARPALHTVKVTLTTTSGKILDSTTVRTGFVSRGWCDNQLTINDKPIAVRGVSLYHDSALSGGTPTEQDMDADLRQVEDLGANALRSVVMPHAQYFYNRCDEKGFLVWVDIPFHRAFLSDVAYYPTPQFEQNGLQQLREIVAQHLNHPSVTMWGIFAQLWMRGDNPVRYIRQLHAEAHRLDPSRPTVACSDQDGEINFVTDLIVWRQDVGWSKGTPDDVTVWRDQLRSKWSHLHSAIAYGGPGIPGHRAQPYRTVPDPNCMPEERQTRFHEGYTRNLQGDSLLWGMWINNLFDYGSTRYPYGVDGKGLVTFDRRTRKDAYYLYRALWNRRSPTLHLTGKHTTVRAGEQQVFRIYSSAGVPLLRVGADTVALHEYAERQYQSDTVTLPLGRVVVRASAGKLRDSVILRIGSAPAPRPKQAPRRTGGR